MWCLKVFNPKTACLSFTFAFRGGESQDTTKETAVLDYQVYRVLKWWCHKNWIYGICYYILKEHDEKGLLAKNQHLIAIWGRDISSVMPWWLHTNPSNFVLVPTKFLVCNQSLEIEKTMVWQPCWMTECFVLSSNMAAMPLSFWISRDWLQTKNCNKMLIFGK